MQASVSSTQFLAHVGRIMLARHNTLAMREARRYLPEIADFSKIPAIIDMVEDPDAYRRKLLAVSVIAKLYCPVALFSDSCRMPKGTYEYMLPALELKHSPAVARIVSAARVYMKNRAFSRQVDEIIEVVRKEVLCDERGAA